MDRTATTAATAAAKARRDDDEKPSSPNPSPNAEVPPIMLARPPPARPPSIPSNGSAPPKRAEDGLCILEGKRTAHRTAALRTATSTAATGISEAAASGGKAASHVGERIATALAREGIAGLPLATVKSGVPIRLERVACTGKWARARHACPAALWARGGRPPTCRLPTLVRLGEGWAVAQLLIVLSALLRIAQNVIRLRDELELLLRLLAVVSILIRVPLQLAYEGLLISASEASGLVSSAS